jgi:ATP-dependent protease HslVU (ClpYQ) peptidase subunit
MTTIAWDGKTLAADKRTSFGSLPATTTKVHRLSGGRIVAGAGDTARICEMVHWLDREDPDKFPAAQRNSDCCSMLVVLPGGVLLQYENTPYPIRIESEKWAVGSGRDFALAAMYLGKDAVAAVVVASVFDVATGNGVDSITLNP